LIGGGRLWNVEKRYRTIVASTNWIIFIISRFTKYI